jgi:hypothetical protein
MRCMLTFISLSLFNVMNEFSVQVSCLTFPVIAEEFNSNLEYYV